MAGPDCKLCSICFTLSLFLPSTAPLAQSPVRYCSDTPPPPFCRAVPGDRVQGYLRQSRSEVIAQHGMVATSQPLAAEAGLQILKRGGNAIDAAGATAAVLNILQPEERGTRGSFFALLREAE